jgi:DNA-binding response OmpR family regulator
MNLRVLLLEDDVFLNDLYFSALSKHGYIVTRARDAQEALDVLDEYGADVLVLDVLLPAHNCLEVLQELQTHSDWSKLPVILMSAQKSEQFNRIQSDLTRCNVKQFLYKPDMSMADLQDAIHNAVYATAV